MPKEDLSIPKITPESNSQTESKTINVASTGDSILIPKIDTHLVQDKGPSAESTISPVSKNSLNSNNNVPNKQFKYKKVLMGIGIFLLVLLVYVAVAGFLLFQSGKKLVASSTKMADRGK